MCPNDPCWGLLLSRLYREVMDPSSPSIPKTSWLRFTAPGRFCHHFMGIFVTRIRAIHLGVWVRLFALTFLGCIIVKNSGSYARFRILFRNSVIPPFWRIHLLGTSGANVFCLFCRFSCSVIVAGVGSNWPYFTIQSQAFELNLMVCIQFSWDALSCLMPKSGAANEKLQSLQSELLPF